MWWLGQEHGRAGQGRAAQETLYSLNVSVSERWQLSRQMTAWWIVTCTNRQLNYAYYGRFCFNDVLLFLLFSRIRGSWSKFRSLSDAVSGFCWNRKAFYVSSEAWFGSVSIGLTGVAFSECSQKDSVGTNACKIRGFAHNLGMALICGLKLV